MTNEILEKIKAVFGYEVKGVLPEKESQEYEAHKCSLNGFKVVYRSSKITPTKTGQFVTIWKRLDDGPIAPLHEEDAFDFVLIYAEKNEQSGFFLFPKAVLVQKRIVSSQTKEGKRGIRIYPPWDIVESKQAEKTQKWQLLYFLSKEEKAESKLLK